MIGAIVGDIVGSTREWKNIKSKDFELIPPGSRPTDDTAMTLAVAKWLMEDSDHTPTSLVKAMREIGRRYLHFGYAGLFRRWLMAEKPEPYNSWGNGSGMRVSPIGLYAESLDEALRLAEISAAVTHNHPEGIKGAQAIASAVYMAKSGASKSEIKDFIIRRFGYDLDRTLDEIRPGYKFNASCQGSVPEAIIAYLESTGFEDAIRNAISIGGDSDTIGSMTGAIAAAEYGIQDQIAQQCEDLLPNELKEILSKFEHIISSKSKPSIR